MLQAPVEAHTPPSEAVVPTLEHCRLFIIFQQGHSSCNEQSQVPMSAMEPPAPSCPVLASFTGSLRLHSSHFCCCTHAVVGTCSRCQVLDTEAEPFVPVESVEDWVRVCMPVG